MRKEELKKELNELKELVRKLFYINTEDKIVSPFDYGTVPENLAKKLRKYL